MKLSKVILLSTVCSFGYAVNCAYAKYTFKKLSPISTSGIHTYHTSHHLTDETPLLPSAKSVNRQHQPWKSGKNIEALFNLDVQVHSPSDTEHDIRVASVCFITDAGRCDGRDFSNGENAEKGDNLPTYDTSDNACTKAGYNIVSCPAGSHPENACPANKAYYLKCVCDPNITETCNKPYYGVGPSCNGKYASCKRDDDKACKEDGYGQTASCSSVQTPNKKCSYNNSYYDKCVCRSNLVSCTYPQSGVGEACGGKYASCQCPSSYKSCGCGGASGATSCTVNGKTTYSSCKDCCNSSSSNWCSVHATCHGDCCRDGTISSCDTRCGGSGCSSSGGGSGGSSRPPANPWRVWREFLGDHLCYTAIASQCGQSGMYAWVQYADLYCKNTSTGEKKYICKRSGYKASSCFTTLRECNANPDAWYDHRDGNGDGYTNESCNSDGTYNGCPW